MRTVTISPDTCVNLGGAAYRICLPVKELCDTTDTGGGVVAIGEGFNCDICPPDVPYMIPYENGDIIHIQTQYYDSFNPDPKNPASGFGAFIEAVITDGATRIPISTGMVAYGCGKSFQVLEIDTSTVALSSWTVEFTIKNAGGSTRLVTQSQEYCETPADQCRKTLLVQGVGQGVDCFGNCYSEPDAYVGQLISYNNQMRVWGSIKDTGGNFDKPEASGNFFNTTTYENYRLSLGRKIPPFVKNYLLKQVLAAPVTMIDGVDYDIDSFTVDNQAKTGRMFLFGVDLTRKCSGSSC